MPSSFAWAALAAMVATASAGVDDYNPSFQPWSGASSSTSQPYNGMPQYATDTTTVGTLSGQPFTFTCCAPTLTIFMTQNGAGLPGSIGSCQQTAGSGIVTTTLTSYVTVTASAGANTWGDAGSASYVPSSGGPAYVPPPVVTTSSTTADLNAYQGQSSSDSSLGQYNPNTLGADGGAVNPVYGSSTTTPLAAGAALTTSWGGNAYLSSSTTGSSLGQFGDGTLSGDGAAIAPSSSTPLGGSYGSIAAGNPTLSTVAPSDMSTLITSSYGPTVTTTFTAVQTVSGVASTVTITVDHQTTYINSVRVTVTETQTVHDGSGAAVGGGSSTSYTTTTTSDPWAGAGSDTTTTTTGDGSTTTTTGDGSYITGGIAAIGSETTSSTTTTADWSSTTGVSAGGNASGSGASNSNGQPWIQYPNSDHPSAATRVTSAMLLLNAVGVAALTVFGFFII